MPHLQSPFGRSALSATRIGSHASYNMTITQSWQPPSVLTPPPPPPPTRMLVWHGPLRPAQPPAVPYNLIGRPGRLSIPQHKPIPVVGGTATPMTIADRSSPTLHQWTSRVGTEAWPQAAPQPAHLGDTVGSQPQTPLEVCPDYDELLAVIEGSTLQPEIRLPEAVRQDDDCEMMQPIIAHETVEDPDQRPISPLSRLSLGAIPEPWLRLWIQAQRTRQRVPDLQRLAESPAESETVSCADVSAMAHTGRGGSAVAMDGPLVRDRGLGHHLPAVHDGPLPGTVVIGGRVGIVGQIVVPSPPVDCSEARTDSATVVRTPEVHAPVKESCPGRRCNSISHRKSQPTATTVRLNVIGKLIAAGCQARGSAPPKVVVCPRQLTPRQTVTLHSGLPP